MFLVEYQQENVSITLDKPLFEGRAFSHFGAKTATFENLLFVSAPNERDTKKNSLGAIYVYEYKENSFE